MKSSDVQHLANNVAILNQLLAWDLTVQAAAAKGQPIPTVHLKLLPQANVPTAPQLFISSAIVEDTLKKLLQDTIAELQAAGIDITVPIQQYMSTVERFQNHNKTPLDNADILG